MPKNKGWFRSYDRLIDSPEIVQLSDSEFRLLVSMWCLASAGGTEDGLVPFNARALRRRVMPDNTEAEIQAMIEHLIDLELVRPHDQGYVISRWAEHQFRYESKIPSVRKKREHIGNTSGTHREQTGPIESDSESDSDADSESDAESPPLTPPPNEDHENAEVTETGSDQAAAAAAELSGIYKTFEGEWGRPLSPIEIQHITDFCEQSGQALTQYALSIAVARGSRNTGYIRGIMKRWRDNNIKTLAEAQEYEQRCRDKPKPSNGAQPRGQPKPRTGKYDDLYRN